MSNQTTSFDVNLTPYWTNSPNTVLEITYSTTTAYNFTASITGPGIPTGTPVVFTGNSVHFYSGVVSDYAKGETMTYSITLTCNSTFVGQVQNSMEIGIKPNGDAITYQGFLFTNDGGTDNDWNDCVVNFALYNSSTDQ